MEERLKKQAAAVQPNNSNAAPPPPPEKDHPAQQQHKYGGSRPGTARQSQQAVPGALPPTPVGSEGEYELPVDRPPRIVSRPPASRRQAQAYPRASGNTSSVPSPSPSCSTSALRVKSASARAGDSDSVTSISESSTIADYVIVRTPDGDGEH
jgi:hypothetical protein